MRWYGDGSGCGGFGRRRNVRECAADWRSKPAAAKPAPMMVTTGSPTPQKEKPLLPDAFAGWVAAEKPKAVTDPAELDSANAAALKEYGCTGRHDGQITSAATRR